MGYTLRAIWPIEDPSVPLPVLLADAWDLMAEMAAEGGAELVGQPSWTLDGRYLHGEVAARPVARTDWVVVERLRAGEQVAGPWRKERAEAAAALTTRTDLSAADVAARVGMTRRAVQRVAARCRNAEQVPAECGRGPS